MQALKNGFSTPNSMSLRPLTILNMSDINRTALPAPTVKKRSSKIPRPSGEAGCSTTEQKKGFILSETMEVTRDLYATARVSQAFVIDLQNHFL
jgi:hypothetical protein